MITESIRLGAGTWSNSADKALDIYASLWNSKPRILHGTRNNPIANVVWQFY